MKLAPCLLAISCLSLLPVHAARADAAANSIRLSVDGQAARVYPAYGYATDREIYLPLHAELTALGLQFRFGPASVRLKPSPSIVHR